MNDDFENHLRSQPMREVPPHWRSRILSAAQTEPRRPRWLEWLWPAPQAWAVLGAAWVLILAFYLATPDDPASGRSYPMTAESYAALEREQLMMAKLLGSSDEGEAPAAVPVAPKPRSERECKQLAG